MGSRGSDYRRRRQSTLDLYKETYDSLNKTYQKEVSEEEKKAAKDKWWENVQKLEAKGLWDDYLAWIGKGHPSDWTPKSNNQPEPESEPQTPEPEPQTAEEPQTKTSASTPDEERMKNAFNAKSAKEADGKLLPELQRAWTTLTDDEKIAVRSYTGKLAKELNTYLWSGKEVHGGNDNITDQYYKGDVQQPLDLLTSALNKSSLKQDTWLERGISMDELFNFLEIKDVFDIADLIDSGETRKHKGFMSTTSGDIKGSMANWVGDVKLKVFAPKGTKGMYINPVSKFGDKLLEIGHDVVGNHKVSKINKDWDGKTSYASGSEIETLLQRGLNFRVLGQETQNGKLVVTVAVVE